MATRSGAESRDRAAAEQRRREPAGNAGLDDTAKRIIEQLQQDGRRSYAEIGKAVGLSEAAVRQRVQRLRDSGFIQIVGVTDPLMMGFPRQSMIGLKCTGDIDKVADRLASMDAIDYVVVTAGSFDVLVEVVCEDDDHLLELLKLIRSIDGVLTTESFVYLKLRKQTYSWGTR
ncbi:MAG TPA: Lrp/AsnC family transcriptional regulator [Streptosporangiaceae bacterium]|jgi:Lrp/AsnC family transcriptional regulator for asnA, asnC and gidA